MVSQNRKIKYGQKEYFAPTAPRQLLFHENFFVLQANYDLQNDRVYAASMSDISAYTKAIERCQKTYVYYDFESCNCQALVQRLFSCFISTEERPILYPLDFYVWRYRMGKLGNVKILKLDQL